MTREQFLAVLGMLVYVSFPPLLTKDVDKIIATLRGMGCTGDNAEIERQIREMETYYLQNHVEDILDEVKYKGR